MTEPTHPNRRNDDRFAVDATLPSRFAFRYPDEEGSVFETTVRDVSPSGISFHVTAGLPPLEPGDLLRSVEIEVGSARFAGEVVLLHVTPCFEPGAVCGGLFYPREDADLLALRSLCGERSGG